jgi:oligo-1,6-glucosidase
MTNAGFDKIEDYRDMPTLNEYQHQKNTGGDLQTFMHRIKFECRDNGRTPFQWSNTENAGFTTGTPWIKVNPNYKIINQAAQENDPFSCLNYFRKLVKLRKDNKTLVYGKYKLLDKNNPSVYAYTREDAENKFLIVLNFSTHIARAEITQDITKAKLLLSNYKNLQANNKETGVITLRPCEAIIYKL